MLPVLLISVLGCKGPRPCLDACREDQAFFETCYPSFVEDYYVAVDCYDDIDALGEALAAAESDDERWAVYEDWYSTDRIYACEDAAEIGEQCRKRTRAEFRYLDREGRIERRDECIADEASDDALQEAIDARDCEGFLVALGLL